MPHEDIPDALNDLEACYAPALNPTGRWFLTPPEPTLFLGMDNVSALLVEICPDTTCYPVNFVAQYHAVG